MKWFLELILRLVDGFFELLGRAQRRMMLEILSANPNVGRKVQIKFNWTDWQRSLRFGHFTFAGIALLLAAGTYTLTVRMFSFTHFSILSVISNIFGSLVGLATDSSVDEARGTIYLLLIVLLVINNRKFVVSMGNLPNFLRNLPQYMMTEQISFVKWAEKMTWWERVKSCFVFGAAYFAMMIFPMAVIPALAVANGVFMLSYAAQLRASKRQDEALRTSASVQTAFVILFIATAPLLLLIAIAKS